MNLLSPVSDIMTTNLITVSKHDPIMTVSEIFDQNRIHHVPVTEKGKLVGIVSKSDYLFYRRGYTKSNIGSDEIRLRINHVEEIMTTGIATLESDERINVALEIFKENLFHAIPITNNGMLVGMVTTFDIIKHLSIDKKAINEYE